MKQASLDLRLAPLGMLFLLAAPPARAVISDGMNAENMLGQLDDSDTPVWTTAVPNYRPSAQGFNIPHDIAVDTATHRLFVADFNNNRVLEFDLDSSNNLVDHTADHVLGQSNFTGFQPRITGDGMYNPVGLAFDPVNNRLFVAELSNRRVLVFNATTLTDGQNADYVWGQPNFTSMLGGGTARNQIYYPNKIRYDFTTNRLYVPDTNQHRVVVYDATPGTITNGQNASVVIGQQNFTSAVAAATINGLNSPYGVDIDTASQKLYVADFGNNRVMVYNTVVLSTGMNASYVIGQSTFNTNASGTTQTALKNPIALAYATGTNRLFVSDYSNHRVMIFDVTTSTNNPAAVNVLGQANYTSGSAAISRNGLYYPRGLSFDAGNNRLYVADASSSRVVSHNVSSIVNGQNATDGLGLQDGSGTYSWNRYLLNAPPSARGLVLPYGVVLDTSSHRLFVSDGYNDRVLEFDLDANDQLLDRVADHVLGQSTFSNAGPSTGPARMSLPIGLAYDAANSRLFASDHINNRVLVYDLSGGLSDGQNAAYVLGQTNFTNSSGSSAQSRMYGPSGLAFDSVNSRLYVADRYNHRVLVCNVSTSTISNGQNAAYVLGQPDFATVTSGLSQNKMNQPIGVAVDTSGQRLFVTDYGNNRVLVFDVSALANNLPAASVIGQSDYTSGASAITRNRMSGPYGVAHDPVSGRLYVSEYTNNRILSFDATTVTNGQNAVNVLGQTSFTNGANATTQNRLYYPLLMSLDSAHHRLFIPEYYNHRLVSYLVDLVPSTSTVTAGPGSNSGEVALTWPSAGDEENRGALTGVYRIQYAAYNASWNNTTTPANAMTVTIATTGVTPGTIRSTPITGLVGGTTYSFALFTQDDEGNWSGVSNTATSKPLDLVAPSTSTITVHAGSSPGELTLSWASAGHDGSAGVLSGTYRIQSATFSAVWSAGGSPADVTTVLLATAAVTPGSMRSLRVSGLSLGTVWYFALFTQDDEGHWSDVSNTASAVTTGDGVPPGPVVDLAGSANSGPGSVHLAWSAPGNDGAAGNLTGIYRVQYATFTASWSTATTPANAWTRDSGVASIPGSAQSLDVGGLAGGTQYYFALWSRDDAGNWSAISNGANAITADWPSAGNGMTMVDVAGAGNGLTDGAVAWGDMDGNGHADLVALGSNAGGVPQLRVYWYFGSGAFNPTPSDVAGTGNGLAFSSVALGDSNNDGNLDILAEGQDAGGHRQLRVYPNDGNGSFDSAIEVAGVNNGLSNGGVAWGDYDNDGDLDILGSGTEGANNQLRVHQNNGNGTFHVVPVDVAGLNGGLRDGGVAWADFDGDSDMDVLVSGYDGSNSQLRVYRNNGNGTFNATPINVAGSNGGLRYGGVAWGDMDNDGRVDVLTNGSDGTVNQLRAYKNNGDGTFGSAVDAAGANVGTSSGTAVWGDFNNDGNLDALANGRDLSLSGRIFHWQLDEGSGAVTTDSAGQANTATLTDGPTWGSGKFGGALTFDGLNDRVLTSNSDPFEYTGGDMSYSLWFYSDSADTDTSYLMSKPWNGGGFYNYRLSFAADRKLVAFVGGNSSLTCTAPTAFSTNQWNHVAVTLSSTKVMRLYLNGAEVATKDYSAIAPWVPVVGGDVNLALVVGSLYPYASGWLGNTTYSFQGMIDDVRMYNRTLSAGEVSALYQLLPNVDKRALISLGTGAGSFSSSSIEVDPTNGGLESGSLAMSDVDSDGDLDLAISGTDGSSPNLRVYLSTQSLVQSNSAPSAPGSLSASFSFSTTTVSVGSFTWSSAADNGAGATPANALTYDIQLSTTAGFTTPFFTGALGASPRMGSYLKPPAIFSGGFNGVTLKSADPWAPQTTSPFGLRTDTTYYYRVKTLDAGLTESEWSTAQSLFTGVAPQAVGDLVLSSWISPGVTDLSWTAPGDDANQSPLTGTYQIQYATFPAVWNATVPPADVMVVMLATTSASPGTPQIHRMTGLAPGAPWHFALFTQDDGGNWSEVSNSTSAAATAPPTPPATASFVSRTETTLTSGWAFSLGTLSYTFVASTASDNPPVAVAESSVTAALSGTVTPLTPNTTYFGFVQACNDVGCSAYTAVGSTVTWANPPVTLSTAALTSIDVTLAWGSNGNPNGTTYEIERATEPGGSYTLAVSTDGIPSVVTGLVPGETACFRVLTRSWDNVLTAPSNELCLVPEFADPGVESFTPLGADSVAGSWSSAPGATFYTLRVSTLPENPPVAVAGSNTTAGLTATVATLTPNTTYYGFVAGCNDLDCGADTALGTAVTEAAVPQELIYTGLSAMGVTVSFSANGNPLGTLYEIERAVDGGGYARVLVTTTTSATFTGLTVGTSYVMRVRAVNHGGVTSGYSNELSFTTTAVGPAAPLNLRGSLGTGGITYAWDPVTRDTAGDVLTATVTYKIYQSNAAGGPFTEVATTSGTVYGLVLSPPPNSYHQVKAECLDLSSELTPAIDNAGNGRYVYPSSVGDLAVVPQGLLTGESSARHRVSVVAHNADGGLVGFEVAVVNPSGGSAGEVTFSPVGEMAVALPGATEGVRPVEKWTGSRWSLVGSARVGPPGTVTAHIPRTGIYRVTGTAAGGPLVQEVYNRSFSPNGDGRGDAVVMRVENAENLPMAGAIYSSENMHVADMAPGPISGLTLQWDGRAGNGGMCEGGIYTYEITVGGRRTNGIVVLLK